MKKNLKIKLFEMLYLNLGRKLFYFHPTFICCLLLSNLSCSSISKTDRVRILLKKALLYESENKYEKAEQELDKAIDLDSSISYIYVFRGKIRSLLNDNKSALTDFSKAIKLDKKNTSAYFYKGFSYSSLNNEDSAIINYNLAIGTKMSGDVFFDQRYSSIEDIESNLDVPMRMIRFYRGTSFYEKKMDSLALSDFKFSLDYKYRVVDCQVYIGVILLNRGDIDEGCEYVKNAMEAGDEEAKSFYIDYCDSTYGK